MHHCHYYPRHSPFGVLLLIEIIAAIITLLLVQLAWAGSYTITTNSQQDQRLDRARTEFNTKTCAACQLPPTCTQSEARVCNPGAKVYTDTQDFLQRGVVPVGVQSFTDTQNHDDTGTFCDAYSTSSVAARQQACAAVGSTACPTECR